MNAWALLYDELYGDEKMTEDNRITPQESDEYDPITGVGDKIEIDVPDYSTFNISGDEEFQQHQQIILRILLILVTMR